VKLGEQKIQWVSQYMPLLNKIRDDERLNQPLKDVKIGMSIHLEAKTAYLAMTLKELGAVVAITGSNPLSTQDDVASALKDFGINVYGKHTHDENEYKTGIKKVLDFMPDLILDDGADLTVTAYTTNHPVVETLKGVTEETTTGVRRLRSLHNSGLLKVPVIAVNNAHTKYLFDNRYGTGQSTWDSIMRNTNLLIAGKTVVIAGYGWCGRGIASRAKGLGARVIVTEVEPVRALEAAMDGFTVMTMKEAAEHGDFFITATGDINVIGEEHFLLMKDGAVLANAGHFNVEIDVKALSKISVDVFQARPNVDGYKLPNGKTLYLLSEGRLVNLAGADGHPVEIMDLSFAVQVMSLIYLTQHSLKPGVYPVLKEIDESIARAKLKCMGITIDSLGKDQKDYLESF